MRKVQAACKWLAAVTFFVAAMSATTPAMAAGLALRPSDLPPAGRAELANEIAHARAATPELFRAVADVAAKAPELEAAGRARAIPLTQHLKPLGRRALYPMLELLVFDGPTKGELPPEASTALRLGLIEAVGAIRDARTTLVLSKILERTTDEATVRSASEALARVGTDEAVSVLIAEATQARQSGRVERERAVLAGMHDGRRESVARFLAERLRRELDPVTARIVARSLGGVGNAWAWKTFIDTREAAATRAIAAEALVDAFVRFDGDVREQAAKALLVVDAPTTPSLLATAKASASAEVSAALEALRRRFDANPTR